MMKKIECLGINIAYSKTGSGKQTIVLMHGWGVSSELMDPLVPSLSKYFTVYNFDWPGFGDSDALNTIYTTDDYTALFRDLMEKLEIENPILLGHSFGCRVALRYATKYPVVKMILTGAAGLKPKRGIDYYAKVYTFKTLKMLKKVPGLENLGSKQQFGSEDYQKLQNNDVMRETFKNIVNDDVKDLLKDVSCEVLLVFGSNDDATPLWMGEYLAKHLPNAGLAVFENDDHYAYLHQLSRFIRVCEIFLQTEIKNG